MAALTPKGIQYPTSGDNITPLETHFANLAESADTAIGDAIASSGMPVGGLAGQILAKDTDTDYDTTWIDNYTSQVKHLVKAGEALTKGMPVYVSSANGTNMIVSISSNATEPRSSKTMGLIAQDLLLNGQGFVIGEGLLAGLDTSAASAAGASVWLGVDGALIYGTPPTAPAHSVYLGVVTRKHATQGEIFVKVQNGYELNELHNVAITDVADKQVLAYDSATSLWKNKTATGGVTVSEAAPSSPADGDGWFYAADGSLFVRYNDGTSTQWVQANPPVSAQVEQRYYSPNYIINGAFDFWQRGEAMNAFSANMYTADRWYANTSNQTTVSKFSAGAPVGSQSYARVSTATAGISNLWQPIETLQVSNFRGKTVTFSMKLRRNSSLVQPVVLIVWKNSSVDAGIIATISGPMLATLTIPASSLPTGTTSADWYTASLTFVVPNDGTANTLAVGINAPNMAANSYYEMAQVQLEEGSTATTFRRNANSLQGELAACQRYFWRATGNAVSTLGAGRYTGGGTGVLHIQHPVPMRAGGAAQTLSYNGIMVWGVSGGYMCTASPYAAGIFGTNVEFQNAAGGNSGDGTILMLTADNAYFGFSAEL